MSTWKTRASAASIMGACVFAVASGAGAVFVGDWWGQHHSPVVIQYVDGPVGTSRARHVARGVGPEGRRADGRAAGAGPGRLSGRAGQRHQPGRPGHTDIPGHATPHHQPARLSARDAERERDGDGHGYSDRYGPGDAQRDPEHDADGHADPDRSVVVAVASAVGVPRRAASPRAEFRRRRRQNSARDGT